MNYNDKIEFWYVIPEDKIKAFNKERKDNFNFRHSWQYKIYPLRTGGLTIMIKYNYQGEFALECFEKMMEKYT